MAALVSACKKNLTHWQKEGNTFHNSIITDDELWCHYHILTCKQSSLTWKPVFPDDFLKNQYKHCRKNPYRLKKFCTFFDMGIKLKDFVSTIEIWHTFLNLIISNSFININHIFKCNSIPYTHTAI